MAFREACLANLGFLIDENNDNQEDKVLMFRDGGDIQATNKDHDTSATSKI